jgi:hypothetical protein
MSDQSVVERTLEVIHAEYSQLCAKLGHLGYQNTIIDEQIAEIVAKLKELNIEASKKQAATPKPSEGDKQ